MGYHLPRFYFSSAWFLASARCFCYSTTNHKQAANNHTWIRHHIKKPNIIQMGHQFQKKHRERSVTIWCQTLRSFVVQRRAMSSARIFPDEVLKHCHRQIGDVWWITRRWSVPDVRGVAAARCASTSVSSNNVGATASHFSTFKLTPTHMEHSLLIYSYCL